MKCEECEQSAAVIAGLGEKLKAACDVAREWRTTAEKANGAQMELRNQRDAALGEVERLTDELECAERSLELKSKEIGRSEHCGNTVYYIYDKLGNYSRQLGEVAQERDTLRAECEKLRALQKDHDADWKRIQDAERECERLKSLVKALGGKI